MVEVVVFVWFGDYFLDVLGEDVCVQWLVVGGEVFGGEDDVWLYVEYCLVGEEVVEVVEGGYYFVGDVQYVVVLVQFLYLLVVVCGWDDYVVGVEYWFGDECFYLVGVQFEDFVFEFFYQVIEEFGFVYFFWSVVVVGIDKVVDVFVEEVEFGWLVGVFVVQ